jgi:hypothetical protein
MLILVVEDVAVVVGGGTGAAVELVQVWFGPDSSVICRAKSDGWELIAPVVFDVFV